MFLVEAISIHFLKSTVETMKGFKMMLKELESDSHAERLRKVEFHFGQEINIGELLFQNKKGCYEQNDKQMFSIST